VTTTCEKAFPGNRSSARLGRGGVQAASTNKKLRQQKPPSFLLGGKSESDHWRELGLRFKSTSPVALDTSTDFFSLAFVSSTLTQL
jgi:hypothetical protein